MKLVYIVGNRPQFIKLAVLHQEAKKKAIIDEHIIHTGQHFSPQMSDVFFEDLQIKSPTIHLNVEAVSHPAMIGQMMVKLEPEVNRIRPDFIVVFGDTNTTLAGALTGKKMNIPVVHIEAGIRTGEESMPEESNRYLTDRLAAFNFCCTPSGLENLKTEGFFSPQVHSEVIFSGDLMLDSYLQHLPQLRSTARIINDYIPGADRYILFTLHRKYNLESPERLEEIISALNEINSEVPVVCPIHPNTKNKLDEYNIHYSFTAIEPVGYIQLQNLLHHCNYVITDSGGLQREAFFAKKPTLILMDFPFWPEVLENGCAVKSSSRKAAILNAFALLQQVKKPFDTSIFGDGNAAERIINYLLTKTGKVNG